MYTDSCSRVLDQGQRHLRPSLDSVLISSGIQAVESRVQYNSKLQILMFEIAICYSRNLGWCPFLSLRTEFESCPCLDLRTTFYDPTATRQSQAKYRPDQLMMTPKVKFSKHGIDVFGVVKFIFKYESY